MKVDLSKFEVGLILEAIDAWENEPCRNGMTTSMFGLMSQSPGTTREEATREFKAGLEEGAAASKKRLVPATLLRAKLFQAQAVDPEHTIEQETPTPPRFEMSYECN